MNKMNKKEKNWSVCLVLSHFALLLVLSCDDCVVPVELLDWELLFWCEALFSQDVDLTCKDDFWSHCGVDTAGLDRDDTEASLFEEVAGILAYNSGLIWLGDITEDAVNKWDKMTIVPRVRSVAEYGDNIWALLGNVEKITSTSWAELHSVHHACSSDNV